jgi:ATP-binding cassette subfamily C (CFTR/MRP) protein 1
MVTHPANMVMTIVPRVVAALSGFERIQAFLLRPPLQVNRNELSKGTANQLAWRPASGQLVTPSPAIQISQVQIGHPQVILEKVTINVAAGKLTIISGPTGSGKSTLLRVILGETIPAHGSVSLSTRRIAYCAQRPWLPNGTIKEVIYGATNVYGPNDQDYEKWYDEVINMCSLTHDIDVLADGDQTQIGSRGLNLSGGQRQRVVRFLRLLHEDFILTISGTCSCIIRKMRHGFTGRYLQWPGW